MLLRELGKAWRMLLGMPNTVIFNFHYFPFTQACRLPVPVSHRVKLVRLGGAVELPNCAFGSVRLGCAEVDVFPGAGVAYGASKTGCGWAPMSAWARDKHRV